MKYRFATLAGTALAIVNAAPGAAQSQPTPADDAESESITDIVVTAQRRAESINDVGMAIQAFGNDELTALRVNNVRDLTSIVPSFTVSQSYQGVPTYTLRGIGFNTINLSATSTVGTYVDEVAYAYPIMNTGPVMDLERVEVLKGPQGTLYGRNTTAGLINFITAKPGQELQGGATFELGNYDTYNIGGYISGPLSDTLSARVAFKSENSDKGWQRSNSRGERLGEVEKYGARVAFKFEPSSDTNIDLSYFWWRNKSDTVAGQGIAFTPPTDPANPAGGNARFFNAPGLAAYIAANQPNDARDADWAPFAVRAANIGTGLGFSGPLRENNRFNGLKLRIDQALSDDIKLVSLTSYNHFRRNALSDWSGVPFEILLQNTFGRIRSFAEDFHIEGESGPTNWLAGAYYGKDSISTATARCSARTPMSAWCGQPASPCSQRRSTAAAIPRPTSTSRSGRSRISAVSAPRPGACSPMPTGASPTSSS